jgi:hypothetical protein
MKRFTNLASVFALALAVLILPSVVSAQWGNNRNDDDYYRNGSYNRNIRGTIQNLKNRARNFERRLDRVDDNDRWGNNNRRVDNLQQLADRFVRATDDLADEYGNGRDMRGSRDEARRVLDIGSQIEHSLYNSRSNRNAGNDWNRISSDLRALADAYGLNYNNNGRNRNGNWRDRVPYPLPF